MRELLLSLLGISLFTAAFCGILIFRPQAPHALPSPRTVSSSPATPARLGNTPAPIPPAGAPATTNTDSVTTPTSSAVDTVSAPATSPVSTPPPAPISTNKHIIVTLKDQNLRYFEGDRLIDEFKISSGLRGTPTPPGEYTVLAKKPTVNYFGENYRFPNTKWNLMFKAHSPLNYYIHGAYWHNNFGKPMSHGCVNVSYANMEGLYNWAEVGTPITIE